MDRESGWRLFLETGLPEAFACVSHLNRSEAKNAYKNKRPGNQGDENKGSGQAPVPDNF